MGSVGNTPNHPQLGRPGKSALARYGNDLLDKVNPNYQSSALSSEERKLYSTNCALTSVAGVLQLMGYDVEAMPRDKKQWRGLNEVFEFDWTNYNNYITPANRTSFYAEMTGAYSTRANDRMRYKEVRDNPNKLTTSRDGNTKIIKETMAKWGDNTYGIMTVMWANSGTHDVIVYRGKNDNVLVFDFQTHKGYRLEDYMKRKNLKPGSVAVYRLDNAKIKSDIKDFDKMLKFKGGRKNDNT